MNRQLAILDTSFIVACLCERDVHHKQGKKIYKQIKQKYYLIIPDIVFGETVSVLARRAKEWEFDFRKVLYYLKQMCPHPAMFATYMILFFDEVLKLVEETDGELNFNDALIVIGAREEGVRKIVTFDRDFKDYLEVIGV